MSATLVVLDLREDVDRLAEALLKADDRTRDWSTIPRPTANSYRESAERILAALAPPPRPEEPIGLGAVVVDRFGNRWVRVRNTGGLKYPWFFSANDSGRWGDWDGLHVTSEDQILSRGLAARQALRNHEETP